MASLEQIAKQLMEIADMMEMDEKVIEYQEQHNPWVVKRFKQARRKAAKAMNWMVKDWEEHHG